MAARPLRRSAARAAVATVVAVGLLLATGSAARVAGSAPRVAGSAPRAASIRLQATPVPWRVDWTSAMAWGYGIADRASFREIARVSEGGDVWRVRVSNLFGTAPLVVQTASFGLQSTGPAIIPGSLRALTFGGQPGITIPIGQVAYSDPVTLAVGARQAVAVSLYVADSTLVTVHPYCETCPLSYFSPNNTGDLADDTSGAGYSLSSQWVRFVDAIDVRRAGLRGSIVVLGDSITEGYHTTLRWTTVLNSRLLQLPPGDTRAVVNEGITANTVLNLPDDDSRTGGGPSGLDRLDADVLDQSGVRDVIVLLGTNDLYFGATATQLIDGLTQIVHRVHAAGDQVFLGTLLPRDNSAGWNATREAYREQVNAWIRTDSEANGVIDFSRVMTDAYNGACEQGVFFLPYDSGDNLHPSRAGDVAMGDAVPTTLFGLPEAPLVPPLVTVHRTPGCLPVTTGLLAPTSTPTPTLTPTPSASPTPRPSPAATDRPRRADRHHRASGLLALASDNRPAVAGVVIGVLALIGGVVWALERRRQRRRPRFRPARHR